jgi:anti-anti-sigma factor
MAVEHELDRAHDVVVLSPTDERLTAEIIHEIEALANSQQATGVVLDLGSIRSLVSGSLCPHAEPLRPLLTLHQQLQQQRRKLILCNLDGDVAEVFRITRLDKVLQIQPDVAHALAAIGRT